MTVHVSPTAILWFRTLSTIASIVLGVVGVAGIPEDLATWQGWMSGLQGAVPWWALLVLSAALVVFTWVPRFRVVSTSIPETSAAFSTVAKSPEVQPTVPAAADVQLRAEVEQLRPRVAALTQQVDTLSQQLETYTELPKRVIGVLVAGRPLSIRELRHQLSIADTDSQGIAALEASLGLLGSHGVVEPSPYSVESYRLASNWQERAAAAIAEARGAPIRRAEET
jgi:hypothetical protein